MIIGIVGNVGSGKTLLATLAAITDCEEGKNIFANYKINFESSKGNKPEKVDIGKLVTWLNNGKYHFQLHEALLILDEAYAGLDSRVSSSPFSRYISYFLFQSRKLGYDIVFTCQLSSSVDKRLKNLCDLWIVAEQQAQYIDEENTQVQEYFHYEMVKEGKWLGEFTISLEEAKAIFPFYATQEIVKPSTLSGSTKDKKKRIHVLLDDMANKETAE